MTRSFKLKPSTVHERFGDETVILNLHTGSYYSAQDVGSVIWNMVVGGRSETDIEQLIKAEFSGDSSEISSATRSFLDQLVEESLVDSRPAEEAGTPEQTQPADGKAFAPPLLQKFTDMEEMLLLDPIHEVDEHGWPSTRKEPG